MFQPVEGNVNFPEQELAIGRFWKEHRIYEKSLERRASAPPFVFYEGPPTANGMPHPGHCLTRAIKDLFPRYKTMRGYRCERKAGWDTHGLPVEVEVCKELGIHSKEEIEAYGIEGFIQKCQQSVWRYMQEWERLTERIGFWVDLDDAYVTYHQSYVESVWWSLKKLFEDGLLYQGHKIVWWWAQGGTALSAGEVGLGYREVADPSVYVRFPLLDDNDAITDESLLVWTTTPWTLPSNQFAAVNPDLEYSIILTECGEESVRLIIASDLLETISRKLKSEIQVERTLFGHELVGRRYLPPFRYFYDLFGGRKGRLRDIDDELHRASLLLECPNVIGHGSESSKIFARMREFARARQDDWTAWRVIAARFVTTDSGTGIVHVAPAFGEVDYEVLKCEKYRFDESEGPDLINAVAANGLFTKAGPEFCHGRWVKDCDKEIIRDLKQRSLLLFQEQYIHDYPFCWRAEDDPLIQYPRNSWFIRTTDYIDEMLANNANINWLPDHIKTGRFGKLLESNVDWALSRERYWGTPLPIWQCKNPNCDNREAISKYDELLGKEDVSGTEVWAAAKKKSPNLPEDLKVHKPYIDAITYRCEVCGSGIMKRVPDVIDAWYDSGSMPFAQWGYPNVPGSAERFKAQFPADFISEAIDQTRGWFYSQLAISTMLFSEEENQDIEGAYVDIPRGYPHPFKNCIVLGLMLGEDGQKMSKSKRNYLPPSEIFDKYGADALRWYFFANQPPWTTIRYSEQAIKESIPEFLLRLWNCYSFFVIYANIDEFDPAEEGAASGELRAGSENLDSKTLRQAKSYRNIHERSELDRWILGELRTLCLTVVARMNVYDNYGAAQHISGFIDALSNWYVRRSRDRFWSADKRSVDKLDAYWTLYECLLTTAKLIAPFVPFLAEMIWQNLARSSFSELVAQSVHLCGYPRRIENGSISLEIDDFIADVDTALSQQMGMVREIASLGRNARNVANLKVRQPLAKVEVVLADTTHQKWLEEHADLIADELNVKAVEFTTHGEQYISYSVVPNFKRLGPRLGKNMPAAKKLLAEIDAGKLLAELKSEGKAALNFPDGSSIELDNEDIEVRLTAKEGWAAAQGKGSVVVLATELTPELVAEGLVRDLVRAIQDRRKDEGYEYTDRIEIGFVTNSTELAEAIERFRDFIAQETLAIRIVDRALPGVDPVNLKVLGHEIAIYVQVVKS